MTTVMILDNDGVELIHRHRRSIEEACQRREKQKNCKHNWRYSGHGHNDDAYECTECGATEWR